MIHWQDTDPLAHPVLKNLNYRVFIYRTAGQNTVYQVVLDVQFKHGLPIWINATLQNI